MHHIHSHNITHPFHVKSAVTCISVCRGIVCPFTEEIVDSKNIGRSRERREGALLFVRRKVRYFFLFSNDFNRY